MPDISFDELKAMKIYSLSNDGDVVLKTSELCIDKSKVNSFAYNYKGIWVKYVKSTGKFEAFKPQAADKPAAVGGNSDDIK